MQPPSRWLAHSPMTEPAALSPFLSKLPSGMAPLNGVVQGLLIHCEWLGKYSDDLDAFGPVSRTTLPVRERLADLLERDGRELGEVRAPTQRAVGTCRDFALMLCAFLRANGTPARVRCGFASYLGEAWEDHWVCEYWNGPEGRWCLSDAQLDGVIQTACGVTFDATNLPRDVFLTAGEAWLRCRAGNADPERFGQGGSRGLWFMKVNVVRDAFAVNNRETSPWDRWREAPLESRAVPPDEIALLDGLSRHPEQPVELMPSWLDGSA